MLFERTAVSRKPERLVRKELDDLLTDNKWAPDLVFRTPYILNFLRLSDSYTKRDLERLFRFYRPQACDLLLDRAVSRFLPADNTRGRLTWPSACRGITLPVPLAAWSIDPKLFGRPLPPPGPRT